MMQTGRDQLKSRGANTVSIAWNMAKAAINCVDRVLCAETPLMPVSLGVDLFLVVARSEVSTADGLPSLVVKPLTIHAGDDIYREGAFQKRLRVADMRGGLTCAVHPDAAERCWQVSPIALAALSS